MSKGLLLWQVKKLVEIAPRPITIDFSAEAEPSYPSIAHKPPMGINDYTPAYAQRPVFAQGASVPVVSFASQ